MHAGALLLNLGSIMTRWTNGHWKSTLHRVTNPVAARAGKSRRLSVAFFHKPNYDALIEVLPTCCLEGLESGCTYEDHSQYCGTQSNEASKASSNSNGKVASSEGSSSRVRRGVVGERGHEQAWLGCAAAPAKYPPVMSAELTRAGILHKYRHLPAEEASRRYHEELAATRAGAGGE
jgi:hypothetical protein